MASKKVVYSVLGLRIVTLLFLAASLVVLITDDFKFSDGSKLSFTDIQAYRYVVAVMGIGFLYTLIQLPFAIYFAATEKRWIKTGCLPDFDFYGDKVVSLLLASGVGVGFGYAVDSKTSIKQTFSVFGQTGRFDPRILDEFRSKNLKFLNRALIAIGILLGGFVTMTVTSVITSIKRSEKGGLFR
ncbi:OLC1v1013831C1 [Oldenlandia corymbosa var. corymbosa]|uniref:CASP-like protein n=1 Tax=Oldenlandia corymbosa var. corymbosa TaxID=529605 RepID=A0AAV1DZB7_OLDCO|nr:OLC1v1013831C1 [Oldenlandia corymbosa var. corymbosa]